MAAGSSSDAQMLKRLAETHSRVCISIATLLEATPLHAQQKRRDLLQQWQAAYDDFVCVRSWLLAAGETAPLPPPVPNSYSRKSEADEPADGAAQGKRTWEHRARRLLQSFPLLLCGSFGLAAIHISHAVKLLAFVLLFLVCVTHGVAGPNIASHLVCALVILYRACLLFLSVFVLTPDGLTVALETVKDRASVSTVWLCVGFFLGADPHTSSRTKCWTLLLYGAIRLCGLVTVSASTGSFRVWSTLPIISDLPLVLSFLVARALVVRLSGAGRTVDRMKL